MTNPTGPHVSPGGGLLVQRMGGEDGPYSASALGGMLRSGAITGDTLVRRAEGGDWFRAREIPGLVSEKEWLAALLLSIFLDNLGVDRFYLGHVWLGVGKLATCGGAGIWWLIDVILICADKVEDAAGRPLRK